MENGEDRGVTRVRRRPTRRHRRNRLIRRILFGLLAACIVIGLSAAALYFRSSLTPTAAVTHEVNHPQPTVTAAEPLPRPNTDTKRTIYPHSVVPGGVEDARELKWVAEHDPIVAEHYRGFDYDHARIVRLTLARTVYVSYRIGNHVYWTRHRVSLHKGEKLITDGRMTARARCGNRVEEVPQQLHAAPDPAVAKFEEPVAPSEGSSTTVPPVEFQSSLLNRPTIPGVGPLPPLSLYSPLPGGGGVPISPPPLPTGVCAPKRPGKGESAAVNDFTKKKKTGPCGTNGAVPEPETWLLLITGLTAVAWLARRKALARPKALTV